MESRMIPSLVSAFSTFLDYFYEATPIVIFALSVVLLWQIAKAALHCLLASAKLIAFIALLLALNTALNKRDEFNALQDVDLQEYARENLIKLEELVDQASFEQITAAKFLDYEKLGFRDKG